MGVTTILELLAIEHFWYKKFKKFLHFYFNFLPCNYTIQLQIHVDTTSGVADAFKNFSAEVMARMSDWPFYCTNCSHGQQVCVFIV